MILLENRISKKTGYAVDPETKKPIDKLIVFDRGNGKQKVAVWLQDDKGHTNYWDYQNVNVIGEDGKPYVRRMRNEQ